MKHLVLAPCSRRKRLPASSGLRASNLQSGLLPELAKAWADRVRDAPAETRAGDLYVGRGLAEARRAAAAIEADLRIVSAGLGLVAENAEVPAYSLTVAVGDPDSILLKMEDECAPRHWWQALQCALGMSGRTLADHLSAQTGLVLLALPGTYLDLLTEELLALPAGVLSRVRIVGPPRAIVQAELAHLWMPYDSRFDGEGSPNPGTLGDFAQRAARHFAEEVVCRNPGASAAEHSRMVEGCLKHLSPLTRPKRTVGTDDEIVAVIRDLLPSSGGRSGETLRLLRRQAGRACEQGRFRRLFAVATQGKVIQ